MRFALFTLPLQAVREKLKGLSEEDINKALEFYEEAISDRMEEGLTEDQAVAAIGTPDEIANQILMDTPLPKLVKAKAKSKPKKSFKVWEIVLLVLGFPIWFPLILTAGILALTLVIVLAVLAMQGTSAEENHAGALLTCYRRLLSPVKA